MQEGSATSGLSGLLGLPVVTQTGRRMGRLADVTVHLGPARPATERLLVRSGRTTGHLVAWSEVTEATERRLVLREDAPRARVHPRRPPLEPDELLLGRDVLDTQVVDLRGQRLSRVSEVLLDRSGDTPVVVAVDLGVAALLRRIGLGRLVGRIPPVTVAWADLHLTSRRGHVVQLSTDAATFRRLDARALAGLVARLSTRKATDLLHVVPPAHAAAALHHSHPHTGRRLLAALGPEDRRRLAHGATGEHAATIRELGRPVPALRRRRFLRTAGWRVRRPPRS
jgi:sporulation protein YlmC with PRC-barrel domain